MKRNLSSTSDSDRAESGRVNPPHAPLTPPASSPPREPPSVSQEVGPEVARHVYLKCAQRAHPDITPTDDFEILMLGGSDLKGCTTVAEKRGWLAARRTALSEALGSAEAVLQGAKQMLDRTIETSGVRHICYDNFLHASLYIPRCSASLILGTPTSACYPSTVANIPCGCGRLPSRGRSIVWISSRRGRGSLSTHRTITRSGSCQTRPLPGFKAPVPSSSSRSSAHSACSPQTFPWG